MTTGRVTDIGVQMPFVNETGATPPVNGQDFMGKFKSALETQATAINDLVPAREQTPVQTPDDTAPETKDVSKAPKTGSDRESIKSNVDKEPAKAGKDEVKAQDAEKAAETVDPETVEAIGEATQQIIIEVADELGVTPAEVTDTMQDIGLTMNDLLDPVNMTELVTALSGNQDTVTLLTDEDLYQTLGNLQEFVTDTRENLMSELDLSQEALNEVLDQTEELMQPIADEADPIPAGVKPAVENPMEGMKDFRMTATVNGETVSMDVKVDDTTGAQIVTNIDRSGSPESGQRQPSNEGSGHNEMHGRDSSPEVPLFTQTVQLNTENIQDFTALTDEVTGFRTEASDIANQIMENMRANIRPDVTELEMNLHPASLGNVRVNLTAQNGQVTAQFLAQNETVRAAIESQVVQLRETLEAQGVRIEQVEVAVAGQGFDRNRDNSQGQNDESGREAGRAGRAGRTRRINLNAMEGDDALEELEDADRIAAEMMAHDGNTVDYMA